MRLGKFPPDGDRAVEFIDHQIFNLVIQPSGRAVAAPAPAWRLLAPRDAEQVYEEKIFPLLDLGQGWEHLDKAR
jgi:hypothetical protein